MRILIVEHDEVTIDTYARILRLEGYEPRMALTAEAGLRDVESNPPDAILIDLRMPLVDGLEFLRRLRAHDRTRNTPVAVVTGDYFLDDTTHAQLAALGAQVRFKPLWLDDLTALIHKLLESARSPRGGVPPFWPRPARATATRFVRSQKSRLRATGGDAITHTSQHATDPSRRFEVYRVYRRAVNVS